MCLVHLFVLSVMPRSMIDICKSPFILSESQNFLLRSHSYSDHRVRELALSETPVVHIPLENV